MDGPLLQSRLRRAELAVGPVAETVLQWLATYLAHILGSAQYDVSAGPLGEGWEQGTPAAAGPAVSQVASTTITA